MARCREGIRKNNAAKFEKDLIFPAKVFFVADALQLVAPIGLKDVFLTLEMQLYKLQSID